jgi:hypothetical protein
VFLPLFAALWSLANAAVDHVVLRILGDPRGFDVTFRATALSMGPMIFGVIPPFGPSVVAIWSVVLRIFAYRALHRTTAGRAAAGALMSFLVCFAFGTAFLAIVLIPGLIKP